MFLTDSSLVVFVHKDEGKAPTNKKMATNTSDENTTNATHNHHHKRKVGYRRSSKFALDDLFLDSDSDDKDDSSPPSREQIAAASAGLDFERVSFLEKKDFEAQLRDGGNSEAHYLGVRNKICAMWRRDVRRRLDVTEVIEEVRNYEEKMIRDVFDWLRKE